VVRAFQTGKLAAIVDGLPAARHATQVLAAVPLITARRRIVGVVAVHQLPFRMFHEDQLNQVVALAGHLADLLFDRWTVVHSAPQLERAEDETARLNLHRPWCCGCGRSPCVRSSRAARAAMLAAHARPSAGAAVARTTPIEVAAGESRALAVARIEPTIISVSGGMTVAKRCRLTRPRCGRRGERHDFERVCADGHDVRVGRTRHAD